MCIESCHSYGGVAFRITRVAMSVFWYASHTLNMGVTNYVYGESMKWVVSLIRRVCLSRHASGNECVLVCMSHTEYGSHELCIRGVYEVSRVTRTEGLLFASREWQWVCSGMHVTHWIWESRTVYMEFMKWVVSLVWGIRILLHAGGNECVLVWTPQSEYGSHELNI